MVNLALRIYPDFRLARRPSPYPFAAFILWIVLMWKAFQGEMYKFRTWETWQKKQLAKMGK